MSSTPDNNNHLWRGVYIRAVIVACLLAIKCWGLFEARQFFRAFKEDMEISVDFHDDAPEDSIRLIRQQIDKRPYVLQSRVITKEEALKMMEKELDTKLGEFLGNPLWTSIILKLHEQYVNPDSLKIISNELEQNTLVRKVSYPLQMVDKMGANFRKAYIVIAILSLVLLAISGTLVITIIRKVRALRYTQ